MNNLEFDNKKLELLKRSNILLEKTKKNYQLYQQERKLLLKLTNDSSINYKVWEEIINSMEILINRNQNN